jgi:hypothetical protein
VSAIIVLHSFLCVITCMLSSAGTSGSPEEKSDNSLAFSILIKSAKEVAVTTQFERSPVNMSRDTSGKWSERLCVSH